MFLFKYLIVAFSVGFPVEIKNPDPASQARFPQRRSTERFFIEAATNVMIAGHFSKDFKKFIEHTWRASTP